MHAAINASFRPRSLQAASKIPSFGSPHGLTRMTPAWLVALASSLLGATTADFRSVIGGPGFARIDLASASHTWTCEALAFRRCDSTLLNWQTTGEQSNSLCCMRQAVRVLDDRIPFARECQGRNTSSSCARQPCLASCLRGPRRRRTLVRQAAPSRLRQLAGACPTGRKRRIPGDKAAARHGPVPADSPSEQADVRVTREKRHGDQRARLHTGQRCLEPKVLVTSGLSAY